MEKNEGYEAIKATEKETLKTFKEEIPSQYFSHLDEKEFEEYSARFETIYRDLFKFPKEMFAGKELIDFGAGTGENTIYLANWGAKCTLVEMNNLSQDISKKVFKNYASNPDEASFILSSIFDYQPNDSKKYDIVHCRGVLSHTSAKEKAFKHIATFLKKGGYLIFGDPNKSGGFQNMVQRYAVYKFAQTPDEMVDVCEYLFKDDIDRSEKAVKRTRRAIIFDRWVIQSQDDPSISEVIDWCNASNLKIYSSYPYINTSLFGDSVHNQVSRGCDPSEFSNLFSIPELTWMMQTKDDSFELSKYNDFMLKTNESLQELATLMANFQKSSLLNIQSFEDATLQLNDELQKVDFLLPMKSKMSIFFDEARIFVNTVNKGDLKQLKETMSKFSVFLTDAVGVRHVDFIAYKNK